MIQSNIPHSNNSETGKHKAISGAQIYKMEAALKQLLNNIRGQLSPVEYQTMYAKLINLSRNGIQLLHANLESGKTDRVFHFLKNGGANIPPHH